jgi:hypothetical protein
LVYPVATAPGSDLFAGHKMALIHPICTPFVVQMGPIQAMIDPDCGPKTLRIENFVENQRDKQ